MAALVASLPGNKLVAALAITAIVLALLVYRRWFYALMFASTLVPVVVNMALKEIVDRPRPDMTILISPPTSPGFPSGHAEHAAVLFLLLAFLAGELVGPRWLRWTLRIVLLLAILAGGGFQGVPGGPLAQRCVGGIPAGGVVGIRRPMVPQMADFRQVPKLGPFRQRVLDWPMIAVAWRP